MDRQVPEQSGERDHAPGYNRLLAGEVDFAVGSRELDELQACITLQAAGIEGAA